MTGEEINLQVQHHLSDLRCIVSTHNAIPIGEGIFAKLRKIQAVL